MKKLVCFLTALLPFYFAYSQTDFSSHFSDKLFLNGTFGELRYNHFHAGLDISTNRKTGQPIYAPADGTVNRIKVSPLGYGKALYIKHNDGYTTVYGHLENYAGAIGKYVKTNQYDKESYEIELFPLLNELPVKKGDLIAYSGNTGGSGGPHLHFEVRDTSTEDILNPLDFGLDSLVDDSQNPKLNGVRVYPIGDGAVVNGIAQPFELTIKRTADGSYLAQPVYANGKVGFAIDSYDTAENSYAKYGLYSLEQKVNGKTNFLMVFDRFAFNESHFINQFVDYSFYNETSRKYQQTFFQGDFNLQLLKKHTNQGIIEPEPGRTYNVNIAMKDYSGNTTELNIPLIYKEQQSIPVENDGKYIDYLRDYILEEGNVTISWEANTFYDDAYLDLHFEKDRVKLHRDNIPLQKNITIRFDMSDNSEINKEKAFIGRVDNGKVKFYKTWKSNKNMFQIRTKNLGTYEIVEDLIPPTIEWASENKEFEKKGKLVVKIDDDLSGIDTYEGFINDKWALFEYDYKTQELIHHLADGVAHEGTNNLLIKVADNVGNNTIFETEFVVK